MRTIHPKERRARLAGRHHLATPCDTVETVAESLVGLHSSDPATPYMSCWARLRSFGRSDLERALYEDRTLLRLHGMRRTIWVQAIAVATERFRGTTVGVARREWSRIMRLMEAEVEGDPETMWRGMAAAVLDFLDGSAATTAEINAVVPGMRDQVVFGRGTRGEASLRVGPRLLNLMGMEGSIIRARPLGSWRGSQYAWVRADQWLAEPLTPGSPARARADLLGRVLQTFGPATTTDLRWWTGWTAGHTRAALAAVGATEVRVEGGSAWVAAGDEGPVDSSMGWVAMLPGLDSTAMGWKERDWYIDPELVPHIFDRNGNAGPSVWVDGQIVGGWGVGGRGDVRVRLLADVGRDAGQAVDDRADLLQTWLEGPVTPRFRSPLEKELSAG